MLLFWNVIGADRIISSYLLLAFLYMIKRIILRSFTTLNSFFLFQMFNMHDSIISLFSFVTKFQAHSTDIHFHLVQLVTFCMTFWMSLNSDICTFKFTARSVHDKNASRKDRETDGRTIDRRTDRQTDRQTYGQTDIHTDRLTDSWKMRGVKTQM